MRIPRKWFTRPKLSHSQKLFILVMIAAVAISVGVYYLLQYRPIGTTSASSTTSEWWILITAVRWEDGITTINWSSGDKAWLSIEGYHTLIPGHLYHLELRYNGKYHGYDLVSLREILQ
jgi:hypothetical protein